MSLCWELRTVLTSEANPIPVVPTDDGKSASGVERPGRLVPIDIWNYLISLSSDGPGPKSGPKTDHEKLLHFKADQFVKGWDGMLTQYVGDGASYSVDKCTLGPGKDGKPIAEVAVKKIKTVQEERRFSVELEGTEIDPPNERVRTREPLRKS